jgi:hypothetical protein
MRANWHEHVASAKTRRTEMHARLDAKAADKQAKAAEDHAALAIEFAVLAINEAERAALDAILLRDVAAQAQSKVEGCGSDAGSCWSCGEGECVSVADGVDA